MIREIGQIRSLGHRPALSTVGLLVCGALAGVLFCGVGRSHATGVAELAHRMTSAQAAKIESVNETVSMRVTKIQNTTINAEGRSSTGLIVGSLNFDLTLLNASHGKANFVAASSSGTVRGVGLSNYHASGATAYFKGTITSLVGTGKYAHFKDLGMSYSGTLNRRLYRVSVTLVGRVSR